MYGSRKLTPTEWKVVVLTAWGLNNQQIGQELKCTRNVVKNKLKRIFDKTGMSGRLELTLWLMAHIQEFTKLGILGALRTF